jgi:TPR repeat protein
MASLTPLSKGLIALAVVGGMASAVWHLGLKDWMAARNAGPSASTPASPAPLVTAPSAAVPAAATPSPSGVAPAPAAAEAQAAAKLSTAENAEKGRVLLERGKPAQARVHLEAAVQGGDGPSACHLGEMTLKGQGGLGANQEAAARLFQLAQTRGSICFASGQ